MNSACATSSFLQPINLQLRRTQARRVGKGRTAIEAAATVFWAMATLIATTVAAFA